MASISAASQAWAPTLPASKALRKFQQDAHDAVAETTEPTLAHRRGKCTPSVDTKLANAWLGIYVALTKTSREAATLEAATQASTGAETEESLSEVESPGELSPKQMALFGESLEISQASLPHDDEPLTSTTQPESWADVSDDSEEEEEEESSKGRRRRPHRRRRTRRRGRGGKGNVVVGIDAEEKCNPIEEEEEDTRNERYSPRGVESSAKEAVQTTNVAVNTPFEHAPAYWPLCNPLPSNTFPRAIVSTSSPCACPVGMALGTSPKVSHTPTHCDASARTPPRKGMQMPSMTSTFGTPTNLMHSAAHASCQGSHMFPPSGYPQLPASLCAFGGSPCQGQALASPSASIMYPQPIAPSPPQVCTSPLPASAIVSSYMGTTLLYQVPSPVWPQQISVPPQVCATSFPDSAIANPTATQSPQPQHLAPLVCVTPMSNTEIASPAFDPLRVWLAGGSQTSDADLMMRLQACIPEVYED